MKLSIIIPTYCPTPDVRKVFEETFPLLGENTTTPDVEYVIVRNGGLRAYGIDEHSCHQYVSTTKPLGFARAVNLGIELATGDYFAVVNNDCYVPKGWDQDLLTSYNGIPRCGILSPGDQSVPRSNTVHQNVSWWSCVIIKREVWEDVGPLDDKLLNYRFHDQDWNIRAKKKGYAIARYCGVQVQHQEQTTYQHMKATVNESAERNEMVRRYGFAHFHEWVGAGCP